MMRGRLWAAGVAVVALVAGAILVGAPAQASAPATMFGATTPKLLADQSDTAKIELGQQFRAAVNGQITGVRFFKGPGNTGTHTGSLWAGSTRVATATFTSETASGWQQQTFAAPVKVTAGTTYTVSYLAPKGSYAQDSPYGYPKTVGQLTALKGTYRYGGGYPTSVYSTSNYWVDVLFEADSPVTTTTTTTPTTTTPPTTVVPPTSTPPTTGNNCAAIPSACGFPDATNTGAKGTLRKVPSEVSSGPGWSYGSGYIRIDGAGTVLDSIECACSIDVNGNNVTISNSKLIFGGEWFAVAVRHAQNTLIVDTTIAPAPGGERLLAGIKNIYGDEGGTTVRRVNIAGSSTGVQIDSGLIEDSYIHDMGMKAGDHINGTTSNGGSTLLTIRHNTVFNQFSQTDAVSLFQDFGAQKNRVIDNNLLAGGGYTIYGGANAGKESLATGIRITNNRISKMFYPGGGSYGWLAAWNPSGAGNVLAGNVWDDGTPIN